MSALQIDFLMMVNVTMKMVMMTLELSEVEICLGT